MIDRKIMPLLKKRATEYPVVTLTGPRQSGKTTLCRLAFPKKPYVTLEDPDVRSRAREDPRGFLAQFPKGAILDEIQNVPDLLSYIQGLVDNDATAGRFILTGSQNFAVRHSVNQSLAGRTALLTVLPFSYDEIADKLSTKSFEYIIHLGFYPRIYDKKLDPVVTLRDYLATYVERDVRSLQNISDLSLFEKFLKLCAGRIGQLLNFASLANDVGVSATTIKNWISLLEASYIIFLLQPYHKNFNKRLLKSPKLYFYDVGLAAVLLNIESPQQIERDPLRGPLFENLIVAEFYKQFTNDGKTPQMYFFRDHNQNEVDLLLKSGNTLMPIEIKSAQTMTPAFLKGIRYFKNISSDPTANGAVIYGGEANFPGTEAKTESFRQIGKVYKTFFQDH